MLLSNYINEEKLEAAVNDGWVVMREHEFLPLVLFCYSRKTIREQHWDEVTERCRGLIVDYETHEVISRPFHKFFNYCDATRPETQLANLPASDPIVTNKIDGSLGILWRYKDIVGIASKGAFHSEHAKWMTEYYNTHHFDSVWPVGYTPVFEMVCEDIQSHVIRYKDKDMEGLYLLALINNETGEELNHGALEINATLNSFHIPKHYSGHNLQSAVYETLGTVRNREALIEGFVLSWPRVGQPPLRVKLKTLQFIHLQRLLHHVRPKHILKALAEPHLRPLLDDWLSEQDCPEFIEFINKWKRELESEFLIIQRQCTDMFDYTASDLGPNATRKDFALRFKEHPYSAALFAMLPGRDGFKDYTKVIWKMLEPMVHEKGPANEEEDEEN